MRSDETEVAEAGDGRRRSPDSGRNADEMREARVRNKVTRCHPTLKPRPIHCCGGCCMHQQQQRSDGGDAVDDNFETFRS